jgi:putative chitinase
MNLNEKYKTILEQRGLNTKLRLAHFFAQRQVEKGNGGRESGYYKTIDSLRKTFKTPFKAKSDAFVSQYLRNSEKCLNYVYANRNGNGNEASGDGYFFRGGGDFQTTGREQFTHLERTTGILFVSNPDLINEEANALISAIIYWNDHNLSRYADADNLDVISDIINIGSITRTYGDSNGFKERKNALEEWKIKLKI